MLLSFYGNVLWQRQYSVTLLGTSYTSIFNTSEAVTGGVCNIDRKHLYTRVFLNKVCLFLLKRDVDTGPVTKLKNMSDVHSTLLGVVEIDFQLFRQKEIYEIASDLRNFQGKKINNYWESWFSRIGQNVHLSDVQDRFEVIKIFHLFLYSIKINLFKHVFWDKI